MKKFQFRLEAALRLRTFQVEAEEARLRELLIQRKRWMRSLEAIDEEDREARHFVQQQASETGPGHRSLSGFLVGLGARRLSSQKGLQNTDGAIVEQRKRLLKAQLDERSLLRLKERRVAEWKLAADREFERGVEELRRVFDTKSNENEAAMDW